MSSPSPRGGRQLSITKKQSEMQSGAELLALVRSVSTDGVLSDAETMDLHRWLDANEGDSLPAAAFLRETVERILADGVVTEAERQELHDAVIRVLPPAERDDAKMARFNVAFAKQEEERAAWRERRRTEDAATGVWDFMVAGVAHDGRAAVVERMERMDTVTLRREPTNAFDSNAIAVHLDGGRSPKIGYVPRDMAARMAPLLDRAASIEAFCKRVLDRGEVPIPVIVVRLFDAQGEVLVEASAPQPTTTRAGASAFAQLEEEGDSPKLIGIVMIVLSILAALVFVVARSRR